MTIDLHLRVLAARAVLTVKSPYYRYRYSSTLHAVRVGLAMLASILISAAIHVPDGVWTSITVLTVMGSLQHQGNIRKRAFERVLGTVLGAAMGLLLLVQLHLIGSLPLTYLLISVAAGVCGYFAIGGPGYVALLAAITICVVAGRGDSTVDIGLWRTMNVLIGIAIALAFAFALPIHATYAWRYMLARNLREYARLYTRIATGAPLDVAAQSATLAALSQRLVKSRALMASVAKEIAVPLKELESIQRLNRSLLSALEMMSTAALAEPCHAAAAIGCGKRDVQPYAVRATLIAMARALRFSSVARRGSPADIWPPGAAAIVPVDEASLSGPQWLAQRFAEQVEQLRMLLADTQPRWNIDPAAPSPPQ